MASVIQIDRKARNANILLFLLGIFLTANFSLVPSLENVPRVFDIFLSVMAFFTVYETLSSKFLSKVLWVIPVVFFFFVYGIWGVMIADNSLVIAAARFSSVALSIPIICMLLREKGTQKSILLGAAIGALIVATIAVGQKLQLSDFFFSFVPTTAGTWWLKDGSLRAVGIFGHPNGLSQSQTIGAILALTLVWFPKWRFLGYILFVLIVFATYFATSTRTGIIAAAVGFLVVHACHPSAQFKLLSFLAGWPLFIAALVVGPELLSDRFGSYSNRGISIEDNIAERLNTIYSTFLAIFEYPFGTGVAARIGLLREASDGVAASHNSYVSLGLTFGFFPFLALIIITFRRMTHNRHSVFYPMFLVVVLLISVEDSIYSSSIAFPLALGLFSHINFFPKRDISRGDWASDRSQKTSTNGII